MSKRSLMETTKIFITHMHGDHILGLPSLLLQVGTYYMIGRQEHDQEVHPIHIYGPPGLHHYLCTVLRMTETHIQRTIFVHEMLLRDDDVARMGDSCMWRRDWERFNHGALYRTHARHNYSYPSIQRVPVLSDEKGMWNIVRDDGLSVSAGLISHKIPCFGFVVKEHDVAGKLLPEECDRLQVAGQDRLLLKCGHDVITAQGTRVTYNDVCLPPSPGRKVTILGDTDNPYLMQNASMGCDVLLHECSFDDHKRANALRSGHSTPSMAIAVARAFEAKRVILNHVGSQYVPVNILSTAQQSAAPDFGTDCDLEDQAREAFGLRAKHVHIARDFETVSVPVGGFSIDDNFFTSFDDARENGRFRGGPRKSPRAGGHAGQRRGSTPGVKL